MITIIVEYLKIYKTRKKPKKIVSGNFNVWQTAKRNYDVAYDGAHNDLQYLDPFEAKT